MLYPGERSASSDREDISLKKEGDNDQSKRTKLISEKI